jgi:hypothetical protein
MDSNCTRQKSGGSGGLLDGDGGVELASAEHLASPGLASPPPIVFGEACSVKRVLRNVSCEACAVRLCGFTSEIMAENKHCLQRTPPCAEGWEWPWEWQWEFP